MGEEIDTKPLNQNTPAMSHDQMKNIPATDQVEKERVEDEAFDYQKTTEELATLRRNSDLKENLFINESRAAMARVAELEGMGLLNLKQASEMREAITRSINAGADAIAAKEAFLQQTATEMQKLYFTVDNLDNRLQSLKTSSDMTDSSVKRVRGEMEMEEKMSVFQAAHIRLLEAELEKMRSEANVGNFLLIVVLFLFSFAFFILIWRN